MTCWEVFSLGRTPYSVTDPMALVDLLEGGGRLVLTIIVATVISCILSHA